MRKKLFLTLSALICVLVFAFSFTACFLISGVEEFNAFKKKIISVMNDNGSNIQVNLPSEVNSGTISNMAKYVKDSKIADMKKLVMEDKDVISDVKYVKGGRRDMYEQALLFPLIIGDSLANNHDASTIYNTGVFIKDIATYMELKQSGQLITVEAYIPSTEEDGAYGGTIFLDYKSASDYTFVMLVMFGDGEYGYRFGNAKKEYCYIDYSLDGGYEVCVSSNADEGYISRDSEVVKKCFQLVQSQFDGLSIDDYNRLVDSKRYTMEEEEFYSLAKKYVGQEEF